MGRKRHWGDEDGHFNVGGTFRVFETILKEVADLRRPRMQAKRRLRELLNVGPFELVPIPGRDKDRYGRDLRVVVRNGRSLGDQLVSEGLARA